MKFFNALPSYLLGLIYILASGAFFFMVFTHAPMPETPGMAGDFSRILMVSGFMTVVKVFELVLGLMIIVPKTRKLALVMIAPISLSVFLVDTLIMQAVSAGLVLVLLNILALYQNKKSYQSIVE